LNEAPLSWDEFERVDMRIGRVITVEPLIGARRPSYRMEIDFGPELGVKQSSAQLTGLYSASDLVGRQVVAVVNFAPKRIAGFRSETLVLGVPDGHGNVVALAPEREVPAGSKVF